MDPVVLNPQVGNAGTGTFPGFQFQQEGAIVASQGAQFIKFGIKAGGNNATLTDKRCRFCINGLVQAVV